MEILVPKFVWTERHRVSILAKHFYKYYQYQHNMAALKRLEALLEKLTYLLMVWRISYTVWWPGPLSWALAQICGYVIDALVRPSAAVRALLLTLTFLAQSLITLEQSPVLKVFFYLTAPAEDIHHIWIHKLIYCKGKNTMVIRISTPRERSNKSENKNKALRNLIFSLTQSRQNPSGTLTWNYIVWVSAPPVICHVPFTIE